MAGQPEERMAKRRRTMPEYVKGVETSNPLYSGWQLLETEDSQVLATPEAEASSEDEWHEGEAGIEAEPN